MGKKRTRGKYISKGTRVNVAKETLTAVRSSVPEVTRALNKAKAWKEGKNPWITVPNPVRNETNKKMIRIRANSYYGDPKGRNIQWAADE